MAGGASPTPANLNESFRRLQEQVNDRIAALCSATAETHPALEKLSAHLADIADSAPLSRVGFFGPRGAGKTTLLNRLLGAELLPIGEIAPATAALAEVVGWQKPTYTAIIYYISQQDWDDTVQAAVDELKGIRAALDTNTDIGPATALLHGQLVSLHKSSEIIRGKITKFHWESVPAAELIPAEYSQKLVEGYDIISHDNVNALNSSLDQFCNRACPLWPLVFKIQIFGPFKLLVDGAFSLVDIPGSGDGDPTLLRRYHEGQAMCDRLFYMPALLQLSSPDTARHCGDARTHMSAEFGVVISSLSKISKVMKSDPREVPSRFCEQLKDSFSSDAQRDLFLSVRQRVYCIENSPDLTNPVYEQIFQEFINAEFLSPRGEEKNRIARYVNEVNLAFSVMRTALNLNEHEVAAVKATFSSVHARVSTFVPPPVGQDEWFRSGTHAPDCKMLSDTIHYKELQALLRSGGRYRHLSIPQSAVAAVIDPLAVKGLERAIQSSLQLFNDTVITELLAGLSRVYTKDQMPPLDGLRPLLTVRFHQVAASCAERSLRGICGQELPDFERVGSGCRSEMLSLVREWWQAHNHFRREICNAIASLAQETHLATLASLQTFLLEQLQALATSPLVSKTLKKVDLARLLTPLSEQPDNNPPPPAELLFVMTPPPVTPAVQSAEQQLAALIAANPAIMSTYPVRNSPRPEIGHVYVFANPAYKDNLFKIGFTQRDPGQRAAELQKTGVPLPFRVERCWTTRHVRAFERNMHYIFVSVRAAHNREFFRAPAPLIIEAGNLMSRILDPTGPPILP